MALSTICAELDVTLRAIGNRKLAIRIFQQRIELETHVSVISLGLGPYGPEDFLCRTNDAVCQSPGNLLIAQTFFLQQFVELLVEFTCLDKVGNDDRIGSGPGRAERTIGSH